MLNGLTGSKKGATTGAASTLPSGGRSNNVQVIFNGKILTPQSLIARKSNGPSAGPGEFKDKKKRTDIKPQLGLIETVEESESATDVADKPMRILSSKLASSKRYIMRPSVISIA